MLVRYINIYLIHSYTVLFLWDDWARAFPSRDVCLPWSIMLHLSERLPQETWLGQCQIESAQPNSFCNLVVARITGRQTTCPTFARLFGNKMALWQQSPLGYSLGIRLVGKSRVDSIWDIHVRHLQCQQWPYDTLLFKCSMSPFCFLKLLYVARLWRQPVYLGYITPRVNWGLFVRITQHLYTQRIEELWSIFFVWKVSQLNSYRVLLQGMTSSFPSRLLCWRFSRFTTSTSSFRLWCLEEASKVGSQGREAKWGRAGGDTGWFSTWPHAVEWEAGTERRVGGWWMLEGTFLKE